MTETDGNEENDKGDFREGIDDNETTDIDMEGDNNVEDTLQALLVASLNATDADEINDVEGIAGEYSSLNNTIDELNNFLDRWDERHDRLRAQIRLALEEDERERAMQAMAATAGSPLTPGSAGVRGQVPGVIGQGSANFVTSTMAQAVSGGGGGVGSDKTSCGKVEEVKDCKSPDCESAKSTIGSNKQKRDTLQQDSQNESEEEQKKPSDMLADENSSKT